MKQAKFNIKKMEKSGITYYSINIPAYLNPAGKATRVYYRTKAEAERKRGELIASTRTESKELVLSNAQIVDAQRALQRLSEARLNMSLDKAIELALPLLKTKGVQMTVDELFTIYTERKTAHWKHLSKTNFRRAANRFLTRFSGTLLMDITSSEVEQWLDERHICQCSKESDLRLIRSAFNYAVRQDIIPSSQLDKVELPRRPKRNGVDIFTPEEAARLLSCATEECKVPFALLLFAGIRPKELTRITWANIRDGFIHLTPKETKTQQVRNIEIEHNLAAWLEAYPPKTEDAPICPRNWVRKAPATRKLAGLARRTDAARHSYATYHLTRYRDKGLLDANMGHVKGSDMLMRHYRAASTPAEADAYWSILP